VTYPARTDQASADQTIALGSSWAGEIEVPLINARGRNCGPATFRVFRVTIDVLFDGDSLAVMGRDNFREWLAYPDLANYRVDTLTGCTSPATPPMICVKVADTGYYQIPDVAVAALRARI
jgi:hypothetical protein